jgi:hypothetical protein
MGAAGSRAGVMTALDALALLIASNNALKFR